MAGFPSREIAEETIEKLENELRDSVSLPLYRKVLKDTDVIFSLQYLGEMIADVCREIDK